MQPNEMPCGKDDAPSRRCPDGRTAERNDLNR
jgi:hypothetical protein